MKRKEYGVRRQRRRFFEFRVYAAGGRLKAELPTLQNCLAAHLPHRGETIAFFLLLIIFAHTTFASASLSRVDETPASSSVVAPTDWSVAMVESTMKRYPTADSLKGWGYAK